MWLPDQESKLKANFLPKVVRALFCNFRSAANAAGYGPRRLRAQSKNLPVANNED